MLRDLICLCHHPSVGENVNNELFQGLFFSSSGGLLDRLWREGRQFDDSLIDIFEKYMGVGIGRDSLLDECRTFDARVLDHRVPETANGYRVLLLYLM